MAAKVPYASHVYQAFPDIKAHARFYGIDVLWANFICEQAPKPSVLLWITSALLSRFTQDGNSYLPLQEKAGTSILPSPLVYMLPSVEVWRRHLEEHTEVVGTPEAYKPLILCEDRLYLHRMYHYEVHLENVIQHMSPIKKESHFLIEAHSLMKSLKADTKRSLTDEQLITVYMGLTRALTILSGGPGTGKTWTIKILVGCYGYVYRAASPGILLLAPTGKATIRLKEALRSLVSQENLFPFDMDFETFLDRQVHVRTIDRFLHRAERFIEANRLHLVIVDECSMGSMRSFYQLTSVLGRSVQYVFVGDKDQLPSIEAASFMHDLVKHSHRTRYTDPFLKEIESFLGRSPLSETEAKKPPLPFRDNVVLLQQAKRYKEKSDLHRLSLAINRQQIRDVMHLLKSDKHSNVILREAPGREALMQILRQYLLDHYRRLTELFEEGRFSEAIRHFFKWGVLCPLRKGPLYSTQSINLCIQRMLFEDGLLAKSDLGKPTLGKPMMILENDYTLKVFNGDIGFCVPRNLHAKNRHRLIPGEIDLCFWQGDETMFRCSYERVLKHELCYATTVHKSQGSEYSHVLLILPYEDRPFLNQQILYTAMTRAQKKVIIIGTPPILEMAISRVLERTSALGEALWKGAL